MNKYSHIMVGELIYEHLKTEHGIHLEKESFIRGNVIPDFSYYAVAHPHFMKLSLKFVQAEIEALSLTYLKSALIGSDYSFHLGIICHYYADFFCYAHSSGYKQVVVNHLKYEHQLYEYFQSNFESVSKLKYSANKASASPDEINEEMLSFHAQYAACEPAYINDLIYTLKAFAGTATSLVCCSLSKEASEPLDIYGEVAAV